MKHIILFLILSTALFPQKKSWIRFNQLGYLPSDVKTAVYCSKDSMLPDRFAVVDMNGDTIESKLRIKKYGGYGPFRTAMRLDFSSVTVSGNYMVLCGDAAPVSVRIGWDAYQGSADFLLRYMRQQRCGYNPFLKDSCHTSDGYIIYNPEKDSAFINVAGGWHDASDYLQYVTTSANAVYQMLFAYQHNPGSFADRYDADGNTGANGIPDILDEAKWGLDWLDKMNPAKGELYQQIADDRDHRGFRLPTLDTVSYGRGKERPVYYVTGKPQGVFKYQNKSTGKASVAGKFSSAFALGSKLLNAWYPGFCKRIQQKAEEDYSEGKVFPGISQTAPCRSPYYYEEGNYSDDMELAAAQLIQNKCGDSELPGQADSFALMESVTPWMGADTAAHYQWYPFVNLGHYVMVENSKGEVRRKYISYLKLGLQKLNEKGSKNVFYFGVPFIWCSNNLVAAAITQCRLYYNLTKDRTFLPMEYALRDWLFGCNPWGTGMIYGLPADGDTPSDPHSAFSHFHNYTLDGGLVDGPVYSAIYKRLLGITLNHDDTYKEFQSELAVYHDDWGDYSSNEPTMDGTASLTYYFSEMEKKGLEKSSFMNGVREFGGTVRMDTTVKVIYLCFSGHEFAEGGEAIRKTLSEQQVKASFFFTGDFYRNKSFAKLIKSLKKDGHYLGAHSDKHLLYATWENRDSLLVPKGQFLQDISGNYAAMKPFGISRISNCYFLPPFEWYNDSIALWSRQAGLRLINLTPGSYTNSDYTIPSMGKLYKSSADILKLLYGRESTLGLNGNILLMHIGTHPERIDKFYTNLGEIITELKRRGYKFALFPAD